MKTLPTLYSRTSKGGIQTWTMHIDSNSYWAVTGLIDGKKIINKPTFVTSTNEGRANERDPEMQALSVAQAMWKKRSEAGYFENIDNIDNEYFVEPMLAQNYEDRKDELTFPLYLQPKLDGIRCVCSIKGMQSRNGKAIASAPHIRERLEEFFQMYPDVILDGELYCDKLNNDFNKICSLVKKKKPDEEELIESHWTIQYWVYDMVDTNMTFEERSLWLKANLPDTTNENPVMIVFVPTDKVESFDELDTLYGQYVDAGYEGQMVRQNEVYENKRSKFLLKRKEFQDAEYEILHVGEGEGNKVGVAGYMMLRNPKNGDKTFRSNIKGNRAHLRELFENKDSLIGKMATVKYFNLTPDNVPRFPYVIAIRDYED